MAEQSKEVRAGSVTVPEGWKLVSVEPTHTMCPREQDVDSYRRAIAAAPPAPAILAQTAEGETSALEDMAWEGERRKTSLATAQWYAQELEREVKRLRSAHTDDLVKALKLHKAIADQEIKDGDDLLWTDAWREANEATVAALDAHAKSGGTK